MAKLKKSAFVLLALFICSLGIVSKNKNNSIASSPVQEKTQGWTMEDRQAFYHTTQGTRVLPYRWLLALEDPGLFTERPFLTDEKARRYGLIPDPNTMNNADRLPIGLAKDVAPDGEFISVTCAACHTGQISFNGTVMRIDGGPATHNLSGFFIKAYAALADTLAHPIKFRRFAKKVLGDNYSLNEKTRLGLRVASELKNPVYTLVQGTLRHLYPTEEGPGRLDALGRGGNLVLGTRIGDTRNLGVANGPVSYPHLWGTTSFDWVQWNGSIQQPMARNIGEALGVNALITLQGNPSDFFQSTVNIQNLFLLEQKLEKLEAPRWPENVLGSIDQEKASQGQALYTQHCAACHESKPLPPNEFGKVFLRINMSRLDIIGTDPTAAVNFNQRLVHTRQLSQPPISLPPVITASTALEEVTRQVTKRKYAELGITPEMQNEMNGWRENKIRAPLAYRARNMDGIWASAPYLHNNSVPNLYQLLLPAADRDTVFYVGNAEYDPKAVGFQTGVFDGGFKFRTNITGNSNAGHEFRDGPRVKGVIGPLLTEPERWAIVEYLKTR
ncbi:MAG: cytochrome c [Pyrinomonadaceae bacterium]|nr:cytochrome c [Pyrinomonadaceae bacterium]